MSRIGQYTRIVLACVALIAAATLLVFTQLGARVAADCRLCSVGTLAGVISSFWLGAGGVLLMSRRRPAVLVLGLWLMVPLRRVVLMAVLGNQGWSAAVGFLVVVIAALALFAARADLPEPTSRRAWQRLPYSALILLSLFPLWLLALEFGMTAILATEKPGADPFDLKDKAVRDLLLPTSLTYLATKARDWHVKDYALARIRKPEENRIRRLESPFAGTYRFDITLGNSQPVVVFGRTELHPNRAVWNLEDPSDAPPKDANAAVRAQGYVLIVTVARTAEALPVTTPPRTLNGAHGFEMAELWLSEQSLQVNPDSMECVVITRDVLRAAFFLFRGERLFDESEFGPEAMTFKGIRVDRATGRLRLFADGRAEALAQVQNQGAPVLTVTATRISPVTATAAE